MEPENDKRTPVRAAAGGGRAGKPASPRDAALAPATAIGVDRLQPHPKRDRVPAMDTARHAAFLTDIDERGVLVPLEITAGGLVLDGHERLRAARELGHASVPARVIAPADEVEHMLLAALQRRCLTPSQQAALVLDLEEYRQAREGARQRQRANLRRSEVATLPPRGEKTREVAARIAGVSARTVQDALTVKEGDAVLFEAVKAGRLPVHRAARRVRRARRDAELKPAPPLPGGPFQLIYGDPPWQLGDPDGANAPENHYPTMPLADIAALAPPAAADAVLFLWAVNMLLPEALQVMEAWGFTYVTNLAWVKPSIGLGTWTRNRHELLLQGRRGRFPAPDPEDRPDSVIEAARRRHSQKPACVYDLLERAYPHATKLELFARQARPGWTAWGNQAPQ